jgi:hypothetical protein
MARRATEQDGRHVGQIGSRLALAVLLTAEQVAELLQVPSHGSTSRHATDAFPHGRLGRYVRFERDQIDLWLNQLCNDGRNLPRGVVLANIR